MTTTRAPSTGYPYLLCSISGGGGAGRTYFGATAEPAKWPPDRDVEQAHGCSIQHSHQVLEDKK